MMHGEGSGFLSQAILLVSLGLGYVVCYFANQEEKQLKNVGIAIGTFIIVMSLVFLLGSVLISFKSCMDVKKMSKWCGPNMESMQDFRMPNMPNMQHMNMPDREQQR